MPAAGDILSVYLPLHRPERHAPTGGDVESLHLTPCSSSSTPSPSTTTTTPNWSRLPPDLIVLIADRLPLPDLARLRSVCSSFLSSLRGLPFRPPTVPWLALFRPGDSRRPSLLNPGENRSYPFPSLLQPGARLVGSHKGWLITLDGSLYVRLLNPLSKAEIRLPCIATLDDLQLPRTCFKYVHDITLQKVVLSSSPSDGDGFVAIAVYDGIEHAGCLAFARMGDLEWTPVDVEPPVCNVEEVVYHSGKFVVMSKYGNLKAVDLSGPLPVASVMAERPPSSSWFYNPENRYLVSSGAGDLLCVETKGGNKLKVKKFHPEAESCWDTPEDLGGQSIFVDDEKAMSMSAGDVLRLKPNCIYWVIDRTAAPKHGGRNVVMMEDVIFSKIRAFKMEKGVLHECFDPNFQLECPSYKPPFWFLPSLL